MAVPAPHVDESLKLTADAEVQLWEISLKNVPSGGTAVIRFRDGPMGYTTTWSNRVFDHMAVTMSGEGKSAEGERSRPTLRLLNPLGLFNTPAFNSQFDGALITRFIVLRQHLEANMPISNTEMWFISRPKELISGQTISFELRSLSDGPDQLIPARMYIPPDFPFVTI